MFFCNLCVLNQRLYAVVCYLADRNELRSHVIEWLQSEVEPDGWFSKGSNFSDVMLRYFQVCDSKDDLIYHYSFITFLFLDDELQNLRQMGELQ